MDWTDGPGTVSAVVAVLAMIGAFVSFVRSKQRSADADAAAKRAEAAEHRANDARDRAAEALEKIAAASTPMPFVRWSDPIFQSSAGAGAVWRVRNTGNTVARQATIRGARGFVHVIDEEPRDVEPGQSLAFSAVSNLGGPARVEIEWTDANGEQRTAHLHV